VRNRNLVVKGMLVGLGLALAGSGYGFDMGNMMNPSKWMGGNKDGDRDYYDGPGYGYPGGPGYGYPGGPGYGYGGVPGYGYGGVPGYGYGGAPDYGYGGVPGYGYGGGPGSTVPGTESRDAEIRRLRERLRQLEGEVR
jgi:hypothetical protein